MRVAFALLCACLGCGGSGGLGTITVEFLVPTLDIRRFEGEILEIRFVVDNPSGDAVMTIRAIPEDVLLPEIVIATTVRADGGAAQSVLWDTGGVAAGMVYTIEAQAQNRQTWDAPGRVELLYQPSAFVLIGVEPADGATGVARTEPIRLRFNNAVLPESLNNTTLDISYQGTFRVRPHGTALLESNEVTFDPTVDPDGTPNPDGLPADTVITVTIPLYEPTKSYTEFLRDISNNLLVVETIPNSIQFTTGG